MSITGAGEPMQGRGQGNDHVWILRVGAAHNRFASSRRSGWFGVVVSMHPTTIEGFGGSRAAGLVLAPVKE